MEVHSVSRPLFVAVVALSLAACGVPISEGSDADAPPASGAGSSPVTEEGTPPASDAGTPCGAAQGDSPPKLTIHDCAISSGYSASSYTAPAAGGPELVVFGIYESRGDHSAGYHPEGTATVHVRRKTPHILVLSSYEPTLWTLDIAPGAKLEGIILNGYSRQRVAGVPSGVQVTDRSGSSSLSACAYKWPADDQGCDTQKLVSGLRALTGQEVTAFAGCYRATEFTVEDGTASSPSTPAPVNHEASCTQGQGVLSTHVAPARCAPELHLLGVYEAQSDHHSEGAVSVNVTRKAPLILALSSYEPIHWTVNAASGTRIERIVLNGYYPQRVTAPAGIPIDNRSGSTQWLGAYAYAWPSSSGGSDTPGLVSALEQLTSRPLTSFAGCYQSTSFTLGE